MSNYPPPQGYPSPGPSPYASPASPPPRSGVGCLGKLLIGCGIVSILTVVICCGGFYWLWSSIAGSLTQDPQQVTAIAHEIASIDVPPPLKPKGGGRLTLPIVGNIGQGVLYADDQQTAVLIVGSFGDAFPRNFQDQFLEDLQRGQFGNQPAGKNDQREPLKDVKKSREERKIGGQNAVFEITQGVGVRTGKRRIEIQGGFQGHTGPAILVIQADAETLPEDKVLEIIKSIE